MTKSANFPCKKCEKPCTAHPSVNRAPNQILYFKIATLGFSCKFFLERMLPESVSEQCEDAQLCFGSRKVVREGCLRVLPSLALRTV